jgi:hypothetical protein
MAKYDKIIVKLGGKSRELLEKPLADALFMRYSGGKFTGPVTSSSTIKASGGFFQESDIRKKTDIEEISMSLEDLVKISTIYFKYKNDLNKKEIGVIANEVKDICPEIIIEDEDGYLNVDYSKLSVLALEGVKLLYENQINIMMDIQKIKETLKID